MTDPQILANSAHVLPFDKMSAIGRAVGPAEAGTGAGRCSTGQVTPPVVMSECGPQRPPGLLSSPEPEEPTQEPPHWESVTFGQ